MVQPAVSVIVPVYNTAEYLRRCLDSVLHQTLTNIEVIIVDDASSDGSLRLIDEYERADHRVRVVRHEVNQGLHIARIDGVLSSSGRYLAYVDSDDYVTPDIFDYLYQQAVAENADIARMSAQIVNGTGAMSLRFADRTYRHGIEHLDADYYPAMCFHLHRRELWTKALPHFPRVRLLGEDNLTSFVLAYFAGKIISSSRIGYYYVERDGTLTGNRSFAGVVRHIQDRGRIVQLHRTFVDECGGQARIGLDKLIADNRGLLFSYIDALQDRNEKRRAIALFEECWQERVPDGLKD